MFWRLRPLKRVISPTKNRVFLNKSLQSSSLSSSFESDLHSNPLHLLSLLTKQTLTRRLTHQIHAHILTSALIFTQHTAILFNTLLRRYSNGDFPDEALSLFTHLRRCSLPFPLEFDSFTYLFLLQACSNSGSAMAGLQVHGLIFKVCFHGHVYVQTGLVAMYVSNGFFREARKVFDEMPERNLVSWNVIITGLAKWGELGSARKLFVEMPERTVESWTAMIDAHVRQDQYEEAVALFQRMVFEDEIRPTTVTMLVIIPAFLTLGDLRILQSVHGYVEKQGFNSCEIRVANSLVDSYSKCGCIRSALKLFEEISLDQRSMICWSSIISALAMHGMGEEAIEKFRAMEEAKLKPNEIVFLSVLNGCSHGGLVEEGLEFYEKMVGEYGIMPNIKHYGCLVDLLGRAGRLEEAERVALEIPSEIMNDVIWRTLLGACKFHDNVEMGERTMKRILEMENRYGGDYVALSSIFSSVGRYEDSEKCRRLLDERNARKVPGHSLV